MIKSYFKIAWRNLTLNKTNSFINLFGLSVGMTSAVLILFWAQNEMSFNSYHANGDDIYRITNKIKISPAETWTWETSPRPMGEAAKNAIPQVKRSARLYLKETSVLNIRNKSFTEEKCAFVERSWFDMFDYDFVSGNAMSFRNNPFSVILTETTAKKFFGRNDPAGETITIDKQNYTVAGVIKDNRTNSSFQFEVIIPVDAYLSANRSTDSGWSNFDFITFLQLNTGANTALVIKQLNAVMNKNKKDNQVVAGLLPLKSLYFESDLQRSSLTNGNKKTTYIFTALAFLLLIIACINYVNLTTAQASIRSKEISIRKIAGAKKNTLFYQFMTESLTVSLFALLITLVFIKLSLPAFNLLTEKHFEFSAQFGALLKVLGGTLIAATLLNGIYPAILLSSFHPLQAIRGKGVLKLKDSALRKGLVVFQFSLSVVLTISTIVISKQLHFLQQSNPGYNADQVITLEIPYENDKDNSLFYNTLKHSLQSESIISSVSIAGSPIIDLRSQSSGAIDWDGRDTTFNPSIVQFRADANFQKVVGLELAEGKWFAQADERPNNYILNETAVKTFKLKRPLLGQRLTLGGANGQIIGVIKDFHYKSMHEKIGPMVISNDASNGHFVYVKASAGNSTKALNLLESNWKNYFPSQPFAYTFLDDTFNKTYKTDIKVSQIILVFSLIAICICALGLFGLSTFTAQRRTKEIGVRKVLGASVSDIITLLSGDFIKLVLIAILIACAPAWYFMNIWLQDFAYRINIHWWMFVAAALFALLIAFTTISFQAIKAAIANPVKSLRSE